ncbi:hypothetical protein [Dongia sedimenti]|uniref:Uncharacterized protein n=1 Tax=Dongia sedimenti TaxID=3064282 RepID=A0ABU0YSY1_9PROT|nr:hypothetical protein [Rhodospirillaceae bacterium R-7]
MPTYAHRKLIEQIARLDHVPSDPEEFSEWIGARAHMDLLKANAQAEEIIIYGSGPFALIHSIVVPDDALVAANKEDLLMWGCNPYTTIASYVSGGGREETWIEHTGNGRGCPVLDAGFDLIFARTFEGWSGDGRTYFEVNQEYSHLSGIHWRPEHSSYCRYDENGDLAELVSMTVSDKTHPDVSLVSFSWPSLEEYLAISKRALVRMFDFTLVRRESFSVWPQGEEEVIKDSDDFFYRHKLTAIGGYTHGIQIIRPRRTLKASWSTRRSKIYVEFIAHDWRNRRVARISTDPNATTNYFQAENNDLPYELSPAFFKPEVLSKYKTDREKYTVSDRILRCRAAWSLRGFDVNEAGQVHAYICDLRDLPHTEQLHWFAFNEPPKAPISRRALINDFEGKFVDFQHPRETIIGLLNKWRAKRVPWWMLRDEGLLSRANVPLTTSKDEWSEAFMDLAKLVIEGFHVKFVRQRLDSLGVAYTKEEQSIALLEKLVACRNEDKSTAALTGLRTAQHVRSKGKGHASGSEGKRLAQEAIAQHGTFAAHFTNVCQLIVIELETIQHVLEDSAE